MPVGMQQNHYGKGGGIMPDIQYLEDGNVAYFNGMRYRKDKKTGYFLHTVSGGRTGSRLHRDVYEYYNGEIPKGYNIHHIDHDKMNNEIDNLLCMEAKKHAILHGKELTEEQREWKRRNVIEKAVPKAIEYQKSGRAREFHKKHYQNMKEKLYVKKEFECEYCNKTFIAINNGQNKFCSNKCKSAWRRQQGLDNVERICKKCGKKFISNKYKKAKFCSIKCSNSYRAGITAGD